VYTIAASGAGTGSVLPLQPPMALAVQSAITIARFAGLFRII
jgi:hypothetical protein